MALWALDLDMQKALKERQEVLDTLTVATDAINEAKKKKLKAKLSPKSHVIMAKSDTACDNSMVTHRIYLEVCRKMQWIPMVSGFCDPLLSNSHTFLGYSVYEDAYQQLEFFANKQVAWNPQYSMLGKTLRDGKKLTTEHPDTDLVIFLPMTRAQVKEFLKQHDGYYNVVALYAHGVQVFTEPTKDVYDYENRKLYQGSTECILVLEKSNRPANRYKAWDLETLKPFVYEVTGALDAERSKGYEEGKQAWWTALKDNKDMMEIALKEARTVNMLRKREEKARTKASSVSEDELTESEGTYVCECGKTISKTNKSHHDAVCKMNTEECLTCNKKFTKGMLARHLPTCRPTCCGKTFQKKYHLD